MPNIKSARKRMRTSEISRVRNKMVKTRVKNARRKMMEATTETPAPTSPETYRTYCSVLDKAAKKGVISKNTAIRRKRRAAERIRPAAEA